MSDSQDPCCSECARTRELLMKLDERVTALEFEVRGETPEAMLEQFEAWQAKRDARKVAIEEFHRLRREEFLTMLPALRETAEEHREAYENFMRERGFEP